MRSIYDMGRAVRNFMTRDEKEVYKKFLPEYRMDIDPKDPDAEELACIPWPIKAVKE